jgi:predicted ATPase/transcriptional regulator with XRE-family HTH domain
MERHAPAVIHGDFGTQLRRHRAAAGLTQEELAERAGLSARAISDLERGLSRAPQRYTLDRLAAALGLAHPDLAAFFAAARRARPFAAAATPATDPYPGWPSPPTPLVGRERELAVTTAHLRDPEVRLLTLLGPPGIGKTRLGLAVATRARDGFAGAAFVALATLHDPALVAPAIAQTLGLREADGPALPGQLARHIGDRRLLLVLDNCEQVKAAAPLVAELLVACPALTILATSRAPLRLRGEREFTVPPLALPDPRRLPPVAELARLAALALFVQRARDVRPDFALTAENAAAVAEICARLDGLPLAIELAASWSKVLEPAALLARLGRRLQVLTGGARDLPLRQQTLRAAIDWSYDLLGEPERVLLLRLAVFTGGGTLSAVEAVCGDAPTPDLAVLAGLAGLMDASLVQRDDDKAEPRFAMLETIREYAAERLRERGEEVTARGRHTAHYLALAERPWLQLQGAERGEWLERLEREHDNLRAALRWAIESGDADTGQRLAVALMPFWYARGHLGEGRAWFDAALAMGGGVARPAALHGAGVLAAQQGDYTHAAALGEEALAACRARGDMAGGAAALHLLGNVAIEQGDHARAVVLCEESLAGYRAAGLPSGAAVILNNLGTLASRRGDHERAAAFHAQSLALKRELGDARGIASALVNLGDTALQSGDVAQAAALFADGLARWRELGDKRGMGAALLSLGQAASAADDPTRAAALCEEGLVLLREVGDASTTALALTCLGRLAADAGNADLGARLLVESLALGRAAGDPGGLAAGLEAMAAVAIARADATRAARLCGAAAALRAARGILPAPVDRPRHERLLGAARAVLGEAAFAAAWASGRELSVDDAVTAAVESAP